LSIGFKVKDNQESLVHFLTKLVLISQVIPSKRPLLARNSVQTATIVKVVEGKWNLTMEQ